MCWREVGLVFKAHGERLRHERNAAAWLALHTAKFVKMKKLPSLRDITVGKTTPRRKMDGVELEAMARLWMAGGGRKD